MTTADPNLAPATYRGSWARTYRGKWHQLANPDKYDWNGSSFTLCGHRYELPVGGPEYTLRVGDEAACQRCVKLHELALRRGMATV